MVICKYCKIRMKSTNSYTNNPHNPFIGARFYMYECPKCGHPFGQSEPLASNKRPDDLV